MVKAKLKNKFIVDNKNHIYKYIPSHDYYLKVTPWKQGEDRRKTLDEIDKMISSGKAIPEKNQNMVYQKLNDIWDQTYDTWEHGGYTYEVELFEKTKMRMNFQKVPWHYFSQKDINYLGIEREFKYNYKIGYNCGNLYWVEIGAYLPRVKLYTFINEDTPPDRAYFKWSRLEHIRPIYNKKLKKYI